MLKRAAQLIVLLAALQVAGGHWLALQSVAWVGMLVTYSQGESLSVAVEKTFDGEHPCSLCKVVKQGQSEEQKQQVAKTVLKMDAVLGAVVKLSAPRVRQWLYAEATPRLMARWDAPPLPPPLAA